MKYALLLLHIYISSSLISSAMPVVVCRDEEGNEVHVVDASMDWIPEGAEGVQCRLVVDDFDDNEDVCLMINITNYTDSSVSFGVFPSRGPMLYSRFDLIIGDHIIEIFPSVYGREHRLLLKEKSPRRADSFTGSIRIPRDQYEMILGKISELKSDYYKIRIKGEILDHGIWVESLFVSDPIAPTCDKMNLQAIAP